MKKFIYSALLLIGVLSVAATASANKHEHRSVWMSAYVQDWPKSPITPSSANSIKKICESNLDSLQRNNFTTIYYHVRTMSDAMYNSKYEPWSKYVSPNRGEAPAFDPFEYILESSHKRGLEVYAWLNPYRYCISKTGVYGSSGSELDYEKTHPEWLLKYKSGSNIWTILNPALEEVQQRLVDIVADIMSKYDIDGVVFDDYFYQNGLPASADSKWYNEYKSKGGSLSQLDWRRKNVNDMVRKVNNYIKSTKPWVRFGIGPAGVAGTSKSVANKYGVRPCPSGSDWQYNGIASDPLAWLSEGTIDFISPQVYWPIGHSAADYASISTWWYEVSNKFNRHCYISQNIGEGGDCEFSPFTEYEDQIQLTRDVVANNAPGYVFFPFGDLKYKTHPSNKREYLMGYLRDHLYQDVAFTPAVDWMKVNCPGIASNVVRNGRELSWNGPENVRYSIYAIPKSIQPADFHKEAQYLVGVSYAKNYTLPKADRRSPGFGVADDDVENCNYAVAVLDRYGNEYSVTFEGAATKTAEKPSLTFPVRGAKAPAIFQFTWTGNAEVSEITVAEDAQMTKILARKEVAGTSVFSSEVYDFVQGKTYYWSVKTRPHNAVEAQSTVTSFTVDAFSVTYPSKGAKNCPDNLTVKWMKVDNAEFNVVIARDELFKSVVFETNTKQNSVTVPEYTLMGNCKYYLKVSIVAGSARLDSETIDFTVKNIVPSVPQFILPATNGSTLYSNSQISVRPERGIKLCSVNVSSSTSFSPRGSYKTSMQNFDFVTGDLSTFKLGSTPLKNGNTYYVRAQFEYYNESGSSVKTDWTPVMNFVYSSEAGVDENIADELKITAADNVISLNCEVEMIEVYNIAGELVAALTDASSVEMDCRGVYVVRATVDGKTIIEKVIL